MFWLAAVVLLNDPVVTNYVERLCGRLAPGATCVVTIDTEPRAAAFSDGVRVSASIVAGAKNEAELAGILAHEIAHQRQINLAPAQDPQSGLCLRFAHPDPKVEGAKQWERDADQAAMTLLTKAGYDPINMLRYFSTLRRSALDLPVAFSAEDILIERLQLEATDHPMKDPLVDSPEFQSVRERLK